MERMGFAKEFLNPRSLLLATLLLSLCVSEGVGVQLISYPVKAGLNISSTESVQASINSDGFYTCEQNEYISDRTEIAAPNLKKPSFQRKYSQGIIASAITNRLPGRPIRERHPKQLTILYSSSYACRPEGRAPPRAA
jgi:hypothetical protein